MEKYRETFKDDLNTFEYIGFAITVYVMFAVIWVFTIADRIKAWMGRKP